MKKREIILHVISLLVLSISLFAKSQQWPWAGPFLMMGFSTISFVWLALGPWLLQPPATTNYLYKIGFRLLISLPYSLVFTGLLGAIQHWPWGASALINSLILLIISLLIILVIRSRVEKTSQHFWTKLSLRHVVFILIVLLFLWGDFSDFLH